VQTKDLTKSRQPGLEQVLVTLFTLLPIFRIRWDVVAGGNIWPYFLIFFAAGICMAGMLNPLGGQGGIKPVNYRSGSKIFGETGWTGCPKTGYVRYINRDFLNAKFWEVN